MNGDLMKYDPRFVQAVMRVLEHESGGKPDSTTGLIPTDRVDPGGATNWWGVSLRYLQRAGAIDADDDGWLDGDIDHDGDIDADDIAAMTLDQAVALYHSQWWERYGYGNLVLGVAGKVFDLAVNMGPGQAHKLLQRAVWAADGEITIADDGVLGAKSIAAVSRYANVPEMLAAPLRSEAAGFYRALIAGKPALSKYRNGWLRRAYS